MARYHLRYRNLRPRLLRITKEFFDSHPWTGDEEERFRKFAKWVRRAARVYDVPVPRLEFSGVHRIVGGQYLRTGNSDGVIILGSWSVVTLFHEFRHHLQEFGVVQGIDPTLETAETIEAMEEDARGWSCSLFYALRPIQFRRMVRAGRIRYVGAEDLLITRRDIESGVISGDTIRANAITSLSVQRSAELS